MVAVLPVADPNIFSTAQRVTLAQTQLQLAQSAPQMHNMYQAFYRMYSAMNIRDIDSILRPQRVGMPKDPATENADVLAGTPLVIFVAVLVIQSPTARVGIAATRTSAKNSASPEAVTTTSW